MLRSIKSSEFDSIDLPFRDSGSGSSSEDEDEDISRPATTTIGIKADEMTISIDDLKRKREQNRGIMRDDGYVWESEGQQQRAGYSNEWYDQRDTLRTILESHPDYKFLYYLAGKLKISIESVYAQEDILALNRRMEEYKNRRTAQQQMTKSFSTLRKTERRLREEVTTLKLQLERLRNSSTILSTLIKKMNPITANIARNSNTLDYYKAVQFILSHVDAQRPDARIRPAPDRFIREDDLNIVFPQQVGKARKYVIAILRYYLEDSEAPNKNAELAQFARLSGMIDSLKRKRNNNNNNNNNNPPPDSDSDSDGEDNRGPPITKDLLTRLIEEIIRQEENRDVVGPDITLAHIRNTTIPHITRKIEEYERETNSAILDASKLFVVILTILSEDAVEPSDPAAVEPGRTEDETELLLNRTIWKHTLISTMSINGKTVFPMDAMVIRDKLHRDVLVYSRPMIDNVLLNAIRGSENGIDLSKWSEITPTSSSGEKDIECTYREMFHIYSLDMTRYLTQFYKDKIQTFMGPPPVDYLNQLDKLAFSRITFTCESVDRYITEKMIPKAEKTLKQQKENLEKVKERLKLITGGKGTGGVPIDELEMPYYHTRTWAENPLNSGDIRVKPHILQIITEAYDKIQQHVYKFRGVPMEAFQYDITLRVPFCELISILYKKDLLRHPKQYTDIEKAHAILEPEYYNVIHRLRTEYTISKIRDHNGQTKYVIKRA